MAAMKISDGPRYKRTGSPTHKRERQMKQISSSIFEELLSTQANPRQERESSRSAEGNHRRDHGAVHHFQDGEDDLAIVDTKRC
jgi:hypothetical protein